MIQKNKKKIVFIICTLLLLLFISSRIFFFKKSFLENFASNLTYPFLLISHKIVSPFQDFFQKRQNHKTLLKKYYQLKEENEKLIQENIVLKATLKSENLSQHLVDFQSRYNLETGIFAKILAKNFSEEEHSFIVNRGQKDGIKKDMVAIYKFQLIGKVTEVFRWYSKILLISDRNCKIASYTNTTNANGISIGQNKINNCKLTYVSHLSKIEFEDLILSSGQGLIFPEGFCIGKIIKHDIKDLYHNIEIEPLVNFNSLNFCLLINQEKIDFF